MAQDSPLSIAASITGLLTFVAACIAGFYAHAIGLKNAIGTQAEVSNALDKIDFLESETEMLHNAWLASKLRQPEQKYTAGDFRYFERLYGDSIDRMRRMDKGLRKSAEIITGGHGSGYGKQSRARTAARWLSSRLKINQDIEERKSESLRIFQIQLAMLSAKVDELSYHQNHHNVTCNIMLGGLEESRSVAETDYTLVKMPGITPSSTPDGTSERPKFARGSRADSGIGSDCEEEMEKKHSTLPLSVDYET